MVAPLIYKMTLIINWKFAGGELRVDFFFFNTWPRMPRRPSAKTIGRSGGIIRRHLYEI